MKHKYQQNNSGNALIIILIAIVLLGSLTVMLSNSSSSTEETGDYERTEIQATKLLRYAKSIEQAVTNLRMRGCSENELSFQFDSDNDGDYNDSSESQHNTNSPSNLSCHVFHPNGAGLEYDGLDNGLQINQYHCVDGLPSACPKLNLMVFFISGVNGASGINEELCIQLNNLVGVPLVSGAPPTHDFGLNAVSHFTGSFSGGVNNLAGTFGSARSGCGLDTAGTYIDRYHFYHVILPR